jgi:excisionase family DNA binding protein
MNEREEWPLTPGAARDLLPAADLMTTKEVAVYLRIKERRVYELLRQKEIPASRVTGKWLFPRALIDLWLTRNLAGQGPEAPPPPVIAGSQDPLLDWAVRESGCGLALLPGGSLEGLQHFSAGQALVAGLHLYEPGDDSEGKSTDPAGANTFNKATVAVTFAGQPLVLLEWAKRRQGLVVAKDNPLKLQGIADLAGDGVRLIQRQRTAGSQLLLAHLLGQASLEIGDLATLATPARSEIDLGLAVLEGRADAGLAIEAVARALKLGFVPLFEERYDLLIRRRDYFEAPFQQLMTFTGSAAFRDRAASMGGYDISAMGRVQFNGP